MQNESINPIEKATVYFTPEITPDSIIRIYEALNRPLQGNIAVKISSGEPGGHNFLDPKLIQKFVNSINGTLVECNTVIGYSSRSTFWKKIKFTRSLESN